MGARGRAHAGQAPCRRPGPALPVARPVRAALYERLPRHHAGQPAAGGVARLGRTRAGRAPRRDLRAGGRMKLPLSRIAHARSGDKADRADIGLFAYDAPSYAVIKREVTAERVAAHFAWLADGPVERYALDNILALKFVLNRALQGGAARSLRSDNLGKTIGAALLRMKIEIDPAEAAALPRLNTRGE